MNKKETVTLKNVYKRNKEFYKSDTYKKFFFIKNIVILFFYATILLERKIK